MLESMLKARVNCAALYGRVNSRGGHERRLHPSPSVPACWGSVSAREFFVLSAVRSRSSSNLTLGFYAFVVPRSSGISNLSSGGKAALVKGPLASSSYRERGPVPLGRLTMTFMGLPLLGLFPPLVKEVFFRHLRASPSPD